MLRAVYAEFVRAPVIDDWPRGMNAELLQQVFILAWEYSFDGFQRCRAGRILAVGPRARFDKVGTVNGVNFWDRNPSVQFDADSRSTVKALMDHDGAQIIDL